MSNKPIKMADNKKDEKPCCKTDQQQATAKPVKATELPTHGNPFPAKDVIQDEEPSMLEVKFRSVRTTIQPYVSPLTSAYERTSEFMSVGIAHSQNAMQRLADNQSSVVKAAIISGAGLLGIGLARRRGIFKKLLFGSVFFGGALVACYPEDAGKRAQMLWYIVQNKLPVLAKQQYEKFSKANTTSDESESKK